MYALLYGYGYISALFKKREQFFLEIEKLAIERIDFYF
jgi:hypothetical protein